MCIVICKPKGIEMPDKETLKECWQCNDDGAGFAFVEGGIIHVHKGFMKFKKLYRALRLYGKAEREMVIHFRIGTSGLSDGTATHPFPLSSEVDKVKMKHFTTDGVVAFHNGIIDGFGNGLISDTQQFVMEILAPLEDVIEREAVLKLIAKATGSKWVIMSPEKTTMVGDFNDHGGVYYSNYSWMKREVVRTGWSGYSGYNSYSGYGSLSMGGGYSRYAGAGSAVDDEDEWGMATLANGVEKPWSDLTDEEEEEAIRLLEEKRYGKGYDDEMPYFHLSDEAAYHCNALGEGGMCDQCPYLTAGNHCELAETMTGVSMAVNQ